MMMRSTYTFETRVRHSVRFVCLVDQDVGRSVTNDIEDVIADLVVGGWLRSGDRLIYRDTMGIWDEAVIDSRCHFRGFRSLGGVTTCESALSAACEV